VIAAITGFALGGGLELALAADFRVAALDATIGLPELHLGLIPGGGGTQRLPRLIGAARAKKLIFFGETLTGPRAAEWGLVDEVVEAEQVLPTAVAMAKELAQRAPLALRAAKRSIDVGIERDLESGLRLEEALFASVFATNDAELGLTSFVGSGPRAASFTGR
jgi:enoyl-CoA hydratase